MDAAARWSAARSILADMPARAVAAARTVARDCGLDAAAAYPLRISFSAYVRLAPSPVVARVAVLTPLLRQRVEAWLARELAVSAALDALGVPVIRPADPAVHLADGLAVSLWEYAEHDPGAILGPAEVANRLADLHAAMRQIPVELVDQALPAFDDLREADVPAAAIEALRAALPQRPVQVLHGDAHAGNIMATRRGWLWHDFEETCVGPIEWDLATLSRARRVDGRAALRRYPGAPSYDELQPWVDLRARQVAPWEHLATALRFTGTDPC